MDKLTLPNYETPSQQIRPYLPAIRNDKENKEKDKQIKPSYFSIISYSKYKTASTYNC